MVANKHGSRLSKVTLAVGFVALLVGTLSAHLSPATGYELSIYAATPTSYWIGVGVALAVGLGVSFGRRVPVLVRRGAFLLATATVTSVVALPLIRGYYHFGSGDALTHLGWTMDIVAGRLDPVNMLYPGVHTTTIFVSTVVGTSFSHAQLFVTLAFFLVYVAFVTLCVRALGQTRWAVPIGLSAALLILPNNNVSVHLMAHPITTTLLTLPLVFYLVMKYVTRTGESTNRLYVATPMGVLLALAAVAMILIHPQGALNVVAILVAVAGVQFFFRRFRSNARINGHRPLYVPTLVSLVAFALWAPRHERVRRTARTVADGVLAGSMPADEITQRSASLLEVGGSLAGLFTKLFLVSTVFCVLAAALGVAWYAGKLDESHRERNALLTYLFVALVPLSGAFLVFFVSSMTTQHFRYVGFVMVPVTILGAVALSSAVDRFRGRVGSDHLQVALVVGFLCLFPFTIATVHASPVIYQPSHQVTAQELHGAETAFERMDRDVAFAGVRGGPDRLLDATYGTERADRLGVGGLGPRSEIPGAVFGSNLTTYYGDERYVSISQRDYEREVALYDGFRYAASGFERLDTAPGVDRVYSNGGFRLYLVGNESAAGTP